MATQRLNNGQLYVIDPVDKEKFFINAKDDLYEELDYAYHDLVDSWRDYNAIPHI